MADELGEQLQQTAPAVGAIDLLPHAVEKGVAFVPGAAFYAGHGDPRTLRLSFVTATADQIHTGVAALAKAVREQKVKAK